MLDSTFVRSMSLLHTIETCYTIYMLRMSCSFLHPYPMGSFIFTLGACLLLFVSFFLKFGFSTFLILEAFAINFS